ncbi:MAG: hypothetical protein IJ960_00820 [Oscillospiraceae bacterium]|nr:hypothetical protein [Oscillospiraceae bacterium]
MKIVVEMTDEEFLEFSEWRKEHKVYVAKERAFWSKLEYVAKKVNWAVEPDPKKEGRYKIVDHDHMDELYAMSGDILADA